MAGWVGMDSVQPKSFYESTSLCETNLHSWAPLLWCLKCLNLSGQYIETLSTQTCEPKFPLGVSLFDITAVCDCRKEGEAVLKELISISALGMQNHTAPQMSI